MSFQDWLRAYRHAKLPSFCFCYVGRRPCENRDVRWVLVGEATGAVCRDHAVQLIKEYQREGMSVRLREINRARAEQTTRECSGE